MLHFENFFALGVHEEDKLKKKLLQMVFSSKLSQVLTSVTCSRRRRFRYSAVHRIAWWKFSCCFVSFFVYFVSFCVLFFV